MYKRTLSRPKVKRNRIKIVRNSSRVITRAHIPDISRIPKIIGRVLKLSEESAEDLLLHINHHFLARHKDIESIFTRNYGKVCQYIPEQPELSKTKKLLIGAFFTMEYSIESAALFNPSIVPHPNQEGLPEGAIRFVMSLRATGEGHISSIVFRSGTIKADHTFLINQVSEYVDTPRIRHDQSYDRHLFQLKLESMHAWNETSIMVFENLETAFTFEELKSCIVALQVNTENTIDKEAIKNIYWLADSNYFIRFEPDHDISEHVIFPLSENEIRGIEDARFVKFVDEKGKITYYATYTAYNGVCILPQLLETKDFINFDIITLNGKAAQNKGMALFPRKVNGKYAMLSRIDGENNYIMFSDHLHFWDEAIIIQQPAMPWEFFQIGNCGSPLELDEGWLVLTHGVGAMRQYFIGAILLDLEDPTKIISRLEEPLLTPNEEEREGYVPNVVYSCGAMIHNDRLIVPYAMSDITSGIATVGISELLAYMKPCS
ncbi:glycoside hydrolase family 130 protein [Cyclobacterium sp. SYSU L10401]|uniref:glycoside hydrolase family 130 protein n=1 Tax=Cyclobacterium sp. SYSU L10401 TaxID=2678657 RepID=UPI0013D43936|nr:glycoside hydrolase family 130 protein [Cyclobacterium sp. SYSU L10401]